MKSLPIFRCPIGVALLCAGGFVFCAGIGSRTSGAAAAGVMYVVDSTGDGDRVPCVNFICDISGDTCNPGGDCTLHAAIQASNIHVGSDVIVFNIPTTDPGFSHGSWTINLPRALPDLNDAVTVSGPGADKLTVKRSTASGTPNFSIFNVTTTATVTLSGLTISNSGLVFRGGGVDHENGGALNILNCTVSGNSSDEGGGIYNAGNLTVTNSALSDNNAGSGAGIYNGGTLSISDSTINGNSTGNSPSNGGGIYNEGTLNVANSTISGNSASGYGGGIFHTGSGTANVTNCTIASNFGTVGGGAVNAVSINGTGPFNIRSTIIALNTALDPTNPQEVYGTFTSQGFNLVGKRDGSAGFTQATDQTGTVAAPLDPKLDLKGLKDNGGPTDTIALLTGSPAIDKGSSDGLTGKLTVDQRGVGYARTINKSIPNATGGDGTDIGAFEVGAQIKAVSRKTHGTTGMFDIKLPLTGPKLGVECRKGGSSGIFRVIVTFPKAVTVASASVSPDPAAPGATASLSSFSVSGSQVTVNLTGVSNAQTILLTLFDVSDGTNTNDVTVPMGVLLGDTNNNGSVASNDVTLTQSKVGQAVSTANFREDVTLDGAINSQDVNLVSSKKGTGLP